ncbi:MAG: hypothetical protein V4650_00170 [Pseudomonadota bacterium]
MTNALSTLAYKVKPNVFDLSTGLLHVSLRDQINRAETLIRSLVEAKQLLPAKSSLLIVGAGVAGASAAIAAARHDISSIIVESQATTFSRLRGITSRYAGPHMYEWPLSFHDDQLFPSTTTGLSPWKAGGTPDRLSFQTHMPETADKLVLDWDTQLLAASGPTCKPLIDVVLNVPRVALKKDIKAFARTGSRRITITGTNWITKHSVTITSAPRFIIMAAGFGQETTSVAGVGDSSNVLSGTWFWGNDTLLQPQLGVAPLPANLVVFGGGDGALQDALRALTKCHTPLAFLDRLRSSAQAAMALIDDALLELSSLEQQHRLGEIWTSSSDQAKYYLPAMHDACVSLAAVLASKQQVRNAINGQIRQDVSSVCIVVREKHFSKAYLLNRFLIYLIDECGKHLLCSKLKIFWDHVFHSGHMPSAIAKPISIQSMSGAITTLPNISKVVVRIGVDAETVPSIQLGITKTGSLARNALGRIPLPFAVP